MYKLILGPNPEQTFEIGMMQGAILFLYKYPAFGILTAKDWEHLFHTYTNEKLVKFHKTQGKIIDGSGNPLTFEQIMVLINAGHKMVDRP